MAVKLDHILLGVPDLDAGSTLFAELTGVRPVTGGSHPGFGTRNRLVSLASDVFFELIAPDPAQEIKGKTRAETIAVLPSPKLLTFAVQTSDMAETRALAREAGLAVGEPVAMSRTRPDGVRLDWIVCHFSLPGYADAIPFAIDWQGSPHPAGTTPGGCTVKSFTVTHPRPEGLLSAYRALGIGIPVRPGMRSGLVLVLDTPKGELCLLG